MVYLEILCTMFLYHENVFDHLSMTTLTDLCYAVAVVFCTKPLNSCQINNISHVYLALFGR